MRLKCEIKLNGILFFLQKQDANGEYVLRKDLTQEIKKGLGPYKTKTELIQQNDQEIELTNEDIEVVDNENEDPVVRERARDKYNDKNEEKTRLVNKREQLVREREQIAERLSLRERLKDLFK